MSKNKIPHLHMCFPNRDSGDVSEREDSRPVEAAFDGDFKKPPEKQVVMVSSSEWTLHFGLSYSRYTQHTVHMSWLLNDLRE